MVCSSRILGLGIYINRGGYILVWLFGVWTRVRQEERMLRANFGVNWEEWHSKTPRFLPWRF
jgi:protein-S-isoprenylcysteine O-methyltransferase Ste14